MLSLKAPAREGRTEAFIERVPELVPEEVARKSGFRLDDSGRR
jgi:hypothetical protein